jgi:hypothetical protein
MNFSHSTKPLKKTPPEALQHPKSFQQNFRIHHIQQSTNPSDMSSNVLADRDVNAPAAQQQQLANAKVDVKSMEYHRQVLQSKLEEGQ